MTEQEDLVKRFKPIVDKAILEAVQIGREEAYEIALRLANDMQGEFMVSGDAYYYYVLGQFKVRLHALMEKQ